MTYKVQFKNESIYYADSDSKIELIVHNATKDAIHDCLCEAEEIISAWNEDENNIPDGYEDCTCEIDFYTTCLKKHFDVEYEDIEIITCWY